MIVHRVAAIPPLARGVVGGHRTALAARHAVVCLCLVAACGMPAQPSSAPQQETDGLTHDTEQLDAAFADLPADLADAADTATNPEMPGDAAVDAQATDLPVPVCKCGDGVCVVSCGEDPVSCATDCGSCGNKLCDKGESPANCAQDCAWQVCGNGVCEFSDGGPALCPQDCAAVCGDGTCNKGEDYLSCAVDCGYCGDGVCSATVGESSASCVADCKAGECNPDLASDVTKCQDQNPCTADECDAAGLCKHAPQAGDCDDGNVCTTGDHCQGGLCLLAILVGCDDGNACTADACDVAAGCLHIATKGACSDANACTAGDVCKVGGCSPGPAADCEDGNVCTANGCEPATGCTQTEASGACTDGDLCTTGDACAGGVCSGPGVLDCDDGNPCTKDSCTPGSGCSNQAAAGSCEDGNPCTIQDACSGGVCAGGKLVVCSDDNPCTTDHCNASLGCEHKPAMGACSDGNHCTVDDVCAAGACVAGTALQCEDGNGCTQDDCEPTQGCTSVAADAATCSDGNPCTAPDACSAGVCTSGSVLPCDDGNACTLDGCNPLTGCTHGVASGPCDDGNVCTSGEHCAAAGCVATLTLDCNDSQACTNDTCQPATGCSHQPNTGNACNDGNLCTGNDTCASGVCAGTASGCDDGNACTIDTCASGTGCSHAAGAGACDDGDACTANDTCVGVACTGGVALVCDDDDVCTDGDHCVLGVCEPGAPLACEDDNPCTTDACDAKLGCQHAATGAASCGDFGQCAGTQCACPGNLPIQGSHCPPILSGLTLDGAALAPAFDPAVTTYAVWVPLASASAKLTVQAPPGVAVIQSVNGGPITTLVPGQPGTVPLRLGSNAIQLTAIHAGISRAYTVQVRRAPTVQQAYVKASKPAPDVQNSLSVLQYQYGGRIAASGDAFVIGLPNESCSLDGNTCDPADPQTAQSGAAEVYRRHGTGWMLEGRLKAGKLQKRMFFGAAVAIDGDRLVVGAPQGSGSAWGIASGVPDPFGASGKAFVFERQDGVWQAKATLSMPESEAPFGFGDAVAVSGDTIAVGGGAWDFGAVDVFVLVGGTWQQQVHLKDTKAGSSFGSPLALAGDTLLVGAPMEASKATGVNGAQGNKTAPGAGAAYVFARNGDTWLQQAYLKASNTDAGDRFGTALALWGDTAVVGAPYEDGNGSAASDNSAPASGAAYVFRRVASAWTFEAYLKSPFPDTGDLFGAAAAVQGESILVGAPQESSGATGIDGDPTSNAAPDSGAAYWFAHEPGKWGAVAYLKAGNSGSGDLFGASVAMVGGTLLVDAIGEASGAGGASADPTDDSMPGAGAVYVFGGDACYDSAAIDCDDANPCTADSCDTGQFCHHDALAGGACATGGGQCQSATCVCPEGFGLRSGACWPELLGWTTSLGEPVFSPWSGTYHLTAPFTTGAVTVTATAATGVGLVLRNGDVTQVLKSGTESAPISLPYGVTDLTLDATSSGVGAHFGIRVLRLPASQDAAVQASDAQASDEFGGAVAVDGDTMIVGAPGEDGCAAGVNGDQANQTCGPQAGAAYIFVRKDGTWTQQAYLKSTGGGSSDLFGFSVAISGDTVAVGSPWEAGAGAAYVFVRVGDTWAQQAKLTGSGTQTKELFGRSIAVSADSLVVGAPYQDGGATSPDGKAVVDSGTAYVFKRVGMVWNLEGWLRAAVPGANDAFAMCVAIDGSTIAAGAPYEDGGAITIDGDQTSNEAGNSGAGYVFVRSNGAWIQQAYLKAGGGAGQRLGNAIALSGDTIVAGTAAGSGPYVFARVAGKWVPQATLDVAEGAAAAVAVAADTIAVGAGHDWSPWTGINDHPKPSVKYSSAAVADAGAAYVFVRKGGVWIHQSYIKLPTLEQSTAFGVSVSLSGKTLAVGAPHVDVVAPFFPSPSGSAYVLIVGGP